MNERILRVLEFHKIAEQLAQLAATSMGKKAAMEIHPSIELDTVQTLQDETDEAVQILQLNKTIPLGGIADIQASVKRSVIGGVLNTSECLDVANTIYGGRQVKQFIEDLEMDLPILQELTGRITPLREIERQIKASIDDHGHVMDSASMKLRSIRGSIRTNESRLRDKLDHYTKTKTKMLSDAIITIRNERYVLPVKQEYRGAIGGIVHDQSASGQTLFMEPKAVVDLNNQLQEAHANEKQEIERILKELSSVIAGCESFLLENITILTSIDFIHARGKLAQQMKARMPKMNDDGYIKMKQARHPLIPVDKVVANDIEIGKDYTSIVITGPNTGGKTVTLKMVGLCTIMAQSGLQVPALDGCELSVFEHIFADIGDEQSIEQNLSTFSSHMTNIVHIMSQVNDKTFVLFDELGAGTDPQEGAALAMAILDKVIGRNARVMATTHYPELKAYGYNRDKVINASVEFDVETLQPTYRLLIGVPGRSNAFDIAKRLGLNEEVIHHAKNHINVESNSVENMIASLEQSQIKAQKDYDTAIKVLEESEQLRHDLQKEWQQLEQKKETLFKKAEEKAEKALQKARDEAETIVKELRARKSASDLKEHEWIETRKTLENAKPNLSTKTNKPKTKQDSKAHKTLHPGDDIKLLTVNQNGTVIKKLTEQDYLVQVGIMKVKVKRTDLQAIGKQKQTIEKPLATIKGSQYHVSPELDLRGERYDDALLRLEKYIDDCLLAGYPSVSIIHGKGTGALRKGVESFARQNSRIASSRQGKPGEGGSGVTVFALK